MTSLQDPLNFQEWYPQLEHELNGASIKLCQRSLQTYMGNMASRMKLSRRVYPSFYYFHSVCILSIVYQSVVANIAAANILLGLAPTILANLGPTVSKISFLSLHRLFLSCLLAMGAPATCPSRFSPYSNPLQRLRRTSGLQKTPQVPTPWAAVTSLLQ